MKNILKTIGLVFGLGLFMQACDDWTMPEANIIQKSGWNSQIRRILQEIKSL